MHVHSLMIQNESSLIMNLLLWNRDSVFNQFSLNKYSEDREEGWRALAWVRWNNVISTNCTLPLANGS